jgi:hypothetical protein
MNAQAFSYAEYLVVFATFIYGFVATQFLTGWSSMISRRKEIVISKEHLAWTLFSFILFIDIWWGSWKRTEKVVESIQYFYLSLLSPVIFYFLAIYLFPNLSKTDVADLRKYLNSIFKKIVVVFLLLFFSFFLSSFAFGDLLSEDSLFNTVAVILLAVQYFTSSKIIRRSILSIGGILLGVHITLLALRGQDTEIINGFSLVEYLTVFITFIYGFVASRFLIGWGTLLVNIKETILSNEYLGWTLLVFGVVITIWWNSYVRGPFLAYNIVNFIISLLVPIMIYLFSAVMFPLETIRAGHLNLREYFGSHRKIIFGMIGLIMFSNLIVGFVLEGGGLFTATSIVRMLAIAIAGFAVITTRRWFQQSLLLFGWVIYLTYVGYLISQ